MNNHFYEPHFSAEHMARKIFYLEDKMKNLRSGSLVTRRGNQYIRIPEKRNSYFEKKADSPEGRILLNEILEAKKTKNELSLILKEWKEYYPSVDLLPPPPLRRSLPVPEQMTLENYLNHPNCNNPHPNKTPYVFEDIVLRSRFELIAAQAFKDLGISFKNEFPIITPACIFFMDMVVPVPERGRCVGFEFAGRIDDPVYMNNVNYKITNYISVNLIPNHDVIFVFGGKDWLPSTDEIKKAIIFGIENC